MKDKMNKNHDQIQGYGYPNSIWTPIYQPKFKDEKEFTLFWEPTRLFNLQSVLARAYFRFIFKGFTKRGSAGKSTFTGQSFHRVIL